MSGIAVALGQPSRGMTVWCSQPPASQNVVTIVMPSARVEAIVAGGVWPGLGHRRGGDCEALSPHLLRRHREILERVPHNRALDRVAAHSIRSGELAQFPFSCLVAQTRVQHLLNRQLSPAHALARLDRNKARTCHEYRVDVDAAPLSDNWVVEGCG